jgi:hypothetical protein
MATESDILLRIRTALEAGGLDAAKAKLGQLTQEVQNNAAGTANNAKAQAGMTRSLNAVQASTGAAAAALQGNLGPAAAQFSNIVEQLNPQLMGLAAGLAGFGVGWNIGKQIDQLLGVSQSFGRAFGGDAVAAMQTYHRQMQSVAATRLTALKGELEKLTKATDDLVAAGERAAGRAKAERGAKLEADVAAVKASGAPEDVQREQIAKLRRDAEEADIAEEVRLAGVKQTAAKKLRDDAAAAVRQAEARKAAANGPAGTPEQIAEAERRMAEEEKGAWSAQLRGSILGANDHMAKYKVAQAERDRLSVASPEAQAGARRELDAAKAAQIEAAKKATEMEADAASALAISGSRRAAVGSDYAAEVGGIQAGRTKATAAAAAAQERAAAEADRQAAQERITRMQEQAVVEQSAIAERERAQADQAAAVVGGATGARRGRAQGRAMSEGAEAAAAEKTLRDVRSGDASAIVRVLGIAEDLAADFRAADARIAALEAREKAGRALE